jgi:phage terminase small subunit
MKPQTPRDLGVPGRALWRKIVSGYAVAGCEDLLRQLCLVSDRLAEIRGTLKRDGLVITEGKRQRRHPLVDAEQKAVSLYARLWRQVGLSDPDPADKRRPGRPGSGV